MYFLTCLDACKDSKLISNWWVNLIFAFSVIFFLPAECSHSLHFVVPRGKCLSQIKRFSTLLGKESQNDLFFKVNKLISKFIRSISMFPLWQENVKSVYKTKRRLYRNKVEITKRSKVERAVEWRHQRASKQLQKNTAGHQRRFFATPVRIWRNFPHSSSLVSASSRSSSVSLLSLTKCFALSPKRRSVWIEGSCSVLSFIFDCRWGSYCGQPTCPLSLHV